MQLKMPFTNIYCSASVVGIKKLPTDIWCRSKQYVVVTEYYEVDIFESSVCFLKMFFLATLKIKANIPTN